LGSIADSLRRQRFRDRRDVARIELHVRVAERMDVAHRAVELRGHLEKSQCRRRLEITRRPALDLRVAGLLQQDRQPADLELGAIRDDEIGRARARNQARLRVHAMHVLHRRGCGVDVDVIAAELGRERAPVGGRREHADRRLRRQRQGEEQQREAPRMKFFMVEIPSTCGRRARRSRTGIGG
jgi:hypothetical protein